MHTTDPDQSANSADERDLPPPAMTPSDERAEPIEMDAGPALDDNWQTTATSADETLPPSWLDMPSPALEPSAEPEDAVEQDATAETLVDLQPVTVAVRDWRPEDKPAEPAAHTGASPHVLLVAVGVLIVLALVGLGAIKLHSALPPPAVPTHVVSRATATIQATSTAVPTLPNFTVPNGQIGFRASGAITSAQTCLGTAALPPLTLNVGNSGNVAVDWWVQVTQTLPDGKTLWTGSAPPYGTLPTGQSGQLLLQPDASLCGQLIGHSGTVQYTATVFYGGGNGAFTVTDTITPPPPGTSTPTPTAPPTPN